MSEPVVSTLELVVTEKTFGSLVTNAQQIKDAVEAMLPRYDAANYSDENVAEAKADKATLNKLSKALNDRRIQFEKEYLEPLEPFKKIVSETCLLIKAASGKIDTVVQQVDEKEREAKRALVDELWASMQFSLVPLDKVFRASWLNKTATRKAIHAEMQEIVNKINGDMEILSDLAAPEDLEAVTAMYFGLAGMELRAASEYSKSLAQRRAARAAAELAARQMPTPEPVCVEATEHTYAGSITILPDGAQVTQGSAVLTEVVEEPLLTRIFRVTTTREKIIALGDFMKASGITFEKV